MTEPPNKQENPSGNISNTRDYESDHVSEFEGMVNQNSDRLNSENNQTRTRPHVLEKPFVEKFKDNVWNNDGAWIKAFLTITCFSAISILGFEFGLYFKLADYAQINDDDKYSPIRIAYGTFEHYRKQRQSALAVYLALYIYAELYQILIALIVLYTRNRFHLFASIAFLLIMTIYSIIQFKELAFTINNMDNRLQEYTYTFPYQNLSTRNNRNTTVLALSIMIIVLSVIGIVIQCFVSLRLREKFKQSTAEIIGNNIKMITANVGFNIHRTTLLLVSFFGPGFFIQVLIISESDSNAEFIICVIALVACLLAAFSGDFFVAREKKAESIALTILYLLLTALVIFKIVRLYTDFGGYSEVPARKSVVAFGVITVILLLCLIVLSIKVAKSFGTGLYVVYAKDYNWFCKIPEKHQNFGFPMETLAPQGDEFSNNSYLNMINKQHLDS